MDLIGTIVIAALRILEYTLIARIIMSWIPIPKDNQVVSQIVNVIYQITEPLLAPIRRGIEKLLKGQSMMIDFSPIVVFLIIQFLKNMMLNSMR
ncbi:MAG: YggT family protein [Clostridiales bacterium]